jgi:hypothetical protein
MKSSGRFLTSNTAGWGIELEGGFNFKIDFLFFR